MPADPDYITAPLPTFSLPFDTITIYAAVGKARIAAKDDAAVDLVRRFTVKARGESEARKTFGLQEHVVTFPLAVLGSVVCLRRWFGKLPELHILTAKPSVYETTTENKLGEHGSSPEARRAVSGGEEDKVDPDIPGGYGRTALHLAAECGNHKIVSELLNNKESHEGINPNATDDLGFSPLWLATVGKHYNVMWHLLNHEHTDVDTRDSNGHTPLWLAAGGGWTQGVDHLLKKGAEIQSGLEDTPLWWAARNGHHHVVEQLLEKAEERGGPLKLDEPALCIAAKMGRWEVLNVLLHQYPDAPSVWSSEDVQQSPVTIAAENGQETALRRLFQAGFALTSNIIGHLENLEDNPALQKRPDSISVQEAKRIAAEFHDIISTSKSKSLRVPLVVPFVITADASLLGAPKRVLESLASHVGNFPQLSPIDLAHSLHSYNDQHTPLKTIVFCSNSIQDLLQDIRKGLREDLGKGQYNFLTNLVERSSSGDLVVLFTGEDLEGVTEQWLEVSELLSVLPVAHSTVTELDTSLSHLPEEQRPPWKLAEELLAGKPIPEGEAAKSHTICTAVQIILVDLLRLAGVKPAVVAGLGSGEIAAAYAAGFLSRADAIRIAYYGGLYAHLADQKAHRCDPYLEALQNIGVTVLNPNDEGSPTWISTLEEVRYATDRNPLGLEGQYWVDNITHDPITHISKVLNNYEHSGAIRRNRGERPKFSIQIGPQRTSKKFSRTSELNCIAELGPGTPLMRQLRECFGRIWGSLGSRAIDLDGFERSIYGDEFEFGKLPFQLDG